MTCTMLLMKILQNNLEIDLSGKGHYNISGIVNLYHYLLTLDWESFNNFRSRIKHTATYPSDFVCFVVTAVFPKILSVDQPWPTFSVFIQSWVNQFLPLSFILLFLWLKPTGYMLQDKVMWMCQYWSFQIKWVKLITSTPILKALPLVFKPRTR